MICCVFIAFRRVQALEYYDGYTDRLKQSWNSLRLVQLFKGSGGGGGSGEGRRRYGSVRLPEDQEEEEERQEEDEDGEDSNDDELPTTIRPSQRGKRGSESVVAWKDIIVNSLLRVGRGNTLEAGEENSSSRNQGIASAFWGRRHTNSRRSHYSDTTTQTGAIKLNGKNDPLLPTSSKRNSNTTLLERLTPTSYQSQQYSPPSPDSRSMLFELEEEEDEAVELPNEFALTSSLPSSSQSKGGGGGGRGGYGR